MRGEFGVMDARRVVRRLVLTGAVEEVVDPGGGFAVAGRAGDTEIAVAGGLPRTAAARGRGLRAAWRRRVGNTPLTLVLLADDLGEAASVPRVLVAGPAEADAGPYSVPAEALLAAVEEYAERPDGVGRIHSLSRQLERLAGICGARARAPESEDSLERLRGTDWWEGARERTASIRPGDGWREILGALGYRIERRPVGYALRSGGGAVAAVVIPRRDSAEFDAWDDGRPPEARLAELARAEGAGCGLFASDDRLRRFRFDAPGSGGDCGWLELDATALGEENRPFLALLAADALVSGAVERRVEVSAATERDARRGAADGPAAVPSIHSAGGGAFRDRPAVRSPGSP